MKSIFDFPAIEQGVDKWVLRNIDPALGTETQKRFVQTLFKNYILAMYKSDGIIDRKRQLAQFYFPDKLPAKRVWTDNDLTTLNFKEGSEAYTDGSDKDYYAKSGLTTTWGFQLTGEGKLQYDDTYTVDSPTAQALVVNPQKRVVVEDGGLVPREGFFVLLQEYSPLVAKYLAGWFRPDIVTENPIKLDFSRFICYSLVIKDLPFFQLLFHEIVGLDVEVRYGPLMTSTPPFNYTPVNPDTTGVSKEFLSLVVRVPFSMDSGYMVYFSPADVIKTEYSNWFKDQMEWRITSLYDFLTIVKPARLNVAYSLIPYFYLSYLLQYTSEWMKEAHYVEGSLVRRLDSAGVSHTYRALTEIQPGSDFQVGNWYELNGLLVDESPFYNTLLLQDIYLLLEEGQFADKYVLWEIEGVAQGAEKGLTIEAGDLFLWDDSSYSWKNSFVNLGVGTFLSSEYQAAHANDNPPIFYDSTPTHLVRKYTFRASAIDPDFDSIRVNIYYDQAHKSDFIYDNTSSDVNVKEQTLKYPFGVTFQNDSTGHLSQADSGTVTGAVLEKMAGVWSSDADFTDKAYLINAFDNHVLLWDKTVRYWVDVGVEYPVPFRFRINWQEVPRSISTGLFEFSVIIDFNIEVAFKQLFYIIYGELASVSQLPGYGSTVPVGEYNHVYKIGNLFYGVSLDDPNAVTWVQKKLVPEDQSPAEGDIVVYPTPETEKTRSSSALEVGDILLNLSTDADVTNFAWQDPDDPTYPLKSRFWMILKTLIEEDLGYKLHNPTEAGDSNMSSDALTSIEVVDRQLNLGGNASEADQNGYAGGMVDNVDSSVITRFHPGYDSQVYYAQSHGGSAPVGVSVTPGFDLFVVQDQV